MFVHATAATINYINPPPRYWVQVRALTCSHCHLDMGTQTYTKKKKENIGLKVDFSHAHTWHRRFSTRDLSSKSIIISTKKKDVVESKSIQTLLNPRIRSVICVEVTNLRSMPGSNRNNQNQSAKQVLPGPWQTALCCNAWREVD